MDVATAKDISQKFSEHRLIDAIKMLRYESPMSLLEAKRYLETGAANGKDALFKKLCEDFVKNKTDLLNTAKKELRALVLYIEQLETEIADEASS